MTLEEAIENCELVVAVCRMMPDLEGNDESSAKHRQLAEWLKELKERREQDVPDANVGDTISRQAAIDAFEDTTYTKNEIQRRLSELPPAQPERKKGHWIESHEHAYIGNGVKEWTNWYCSECDAPNDKPTDFCPSCWADMRGEENG